MRWNEIICPDCRGQHRLIAEGVAFAGQPTIAPKEYPLAARYAEFNTKYWNGQLPSIPLGYARMKGLAGRVSYKIIRAAGVEAPHPALVRAGVRDKHEGKSIVPGTLKLELSADDRRPAAAFDSILLHEMIHVEMAALGAFSENHGAKFLARARQVSQSAGVQVPVVCPSEWFAVPVDTSVKRLGLLLLRKKGGTHSFAIVSEKIAREGAPLVLQRWSNMIQYGYVENATLWIVNDPAWTALSKQVPVQRQLGPNTSFYLLKDETPLADLQRDGELLLDVKENMGSSQ